MINAGSDATTVPAFATILESHAVWDIDQAVVIFYKFIMPRVKGNSDQATIKQKIPRWLWNSKRWSDIPEFREAFNLEKFQEINKKALDKLENSSLSELASEPTNFGADNTYRNNLLASAQDITEEQNSTLQIEVNKYEKDLKKLQKSLTDLRATLNSIKDEDKNDIEERIKAQEEEISTATEYKELLELQQEEGKIHQFNDDIKLKEIAGPLTSKQAHEFYSYLPLNPKSRQLAIALGYSISDVEFRELTEEEVAKKYPGVTKKQILEERERLKQQYTQDPLQMKTVTSTKTSFGKDREETEVVPTDPEEAEKRQKDMETWFRDYSLMAEKPIFRERQAGEHYEINLPEEEIRKILFKKANLEIMGSFLRAGDDKGEETFTMTQQKNIFKVKLKSKEFIFDPIDYLATTLFGGSDKPIVIKEKRADAKRINNVVIKGEMPMPKQVQSRLEKGSSAEYHRIIISNIRSFLRNRGDIDTPTDLIEDYDKKSYLELIKALDFLNDIKQDERFEEIFEYDSDYDSQYFVKEYKEIINILKSNDDDSITELNRKLELAIYYMDEISTKYNEIGPEEEVEETEEEVEETEAPKETEEEEFPDEKEGIDEDEDFDERENKEIIIQELLIKIIDKAGGTPFIQAESIPAMKYLKNIASQLKRVEERDIRSGPFIKVIRNYINSSNMTNFGENTEEEFINIFRNIPEPENFNQIEQRKVIQAREIINTHNQTLEQAFRNITNTETKTLLANIDFNKLFASALVNTPINNGFYKYKITIPKKAADALSLKFNIRTGIITLSGKIQYIEEQNYSFTGRRKEGRKGTSYTGQYDIHAKEASAVGRIGPTGETQRKAGQADDVARKKFFKSIQRKYKELLEVVG